MRVSLVLLALVVPLMFSSLVAFSDAGEEKHAVNENSKASAASPLSFFAAEWQLASDDNQYDDIEDSAFTINGFYTAIVHVGNDDTSLVHRGSTTASSHFIRGPPCRT